MVASPRRGISPALVCLLLGLLGALPLVVLTPPFQVPDEHAHFLRIYQLSEFGIWGTKQDGLAGATLPISLREVIDQLHGKPTGGAEARLKPRPFSDITPVLAIPLQPDQRAFQEIAGAAYYSPLAYIPQAVAMAAGRMAGAGPLMLLYLGRLANALASVAVLAAAVRLIPIGREAVTLAALLPMSLTLYASLSADGAVIACCFLFAALTLRWQIRGSVRWREIVVAGMAGVIFCSVKPIYAPLLAAGLTAVPRSRTPVDVFLRMAGLILVVIGVTVAWLLSTSSLVVLKIEGADVARQVAYMSAHPLEFAGTMLRTYTQWPGFYYYSFVGVLGWLNLRLPFALYCLPLIGLMLCWGTKRFREPRLDGWSAAWNLVLIGCCWVLVTVALYLNWTPVGATLVDGVQGRYFLPFSALMIATLLSVFRLPGRWGIPVPAGISIAVILLVQIAVTDWKIIRAYELF